MWGGLHARLSIIIAPPGGVRISIATSMSVSLSVRMSVFVSFCPYFRSNSCVGRLYLRLACSGSLAFWLRSLTRVISYCKKASTIADFLHYFIQRYGNTDRETSSYNTLMQYFAPSPECEVASFFSVVVQIITSLWRNFGLRSCTPAVTVMTIYPHTHRVVKI